MAGIGQLSEPDARDYPAKRLYAAWRTRGLSMPGGFAIMGNYTLSPRPMKRPDIAQRGNIYG